MVGWFWRDDTIMATAGLPVELAAVHDRAADAQAVSADPFGGGVIVNEYAPILLLSLS